MSERVMKLWRMETHTGVFFVFIGHHITGEDVNNDIHWKDFAPYTSLLNTATVNVSQMVMVHLSAVNSRIWCFVKSFVSSTVLQPAVQNCRPLLAVNI